MRTQVERAKAARKANLIQLGLGRGFEKKTFSTRQTEVGKRNTRVSGGEINILYNPDTTIRSPSLFLARRVD